MTPPEATRRSDRRGSVTMSGAIRHNVTCRSGVSINDLSARGCRILTDDEGIAVGTSVYVRLDKLAPLRATARWRNGDQVGLEFDQPLYVAVLDHLLGQWHFPKTVELETN